MGGGGVVKTSCRVQIMLKLNDKLTRLTQPIQIHLPIAMPILIRRENQDLFWYQLEPSAMYRKWYPYKSLRAYRYQ